MEHAELLRLVYGDVDVVLCDSCHGFGVRGGFKMFAGYVIQICPKCSGWQWVPANES